LPNRIGEPSRRRHVDNHMIQDTDYLESLRIEQRSFNLSCANPRWMERITSYMIYNIMA